MKNRKQRLWTPWILLLAAALGVSAVSYFYYAPYVYPSFWRQIGQPMAHVVSYGVPLLFITVFAWFWPTAGGIVAAFYSFFQLWIGVSREMPRFVLPSPVYFVLYGLFIAGGIILIVLGLIEKKPKLTLTPTIRQARRIARIAAFAPIVLTIIIYTLVFPSWFVFGAVPGLITAGIAWFWPAPGGFLMLLLTIPGFYNLFESNYDFIMKLPAYILCLVFIASGFLHLIIAWRAWKRHHSGNGA